MLVSMVGSVNLMVNSTTRANAGKDISGAIAKTKQVWKYEQCGKLRLITS